MTIDVAVLGSNTKELEDLVRSSSTHVTSATPAHLQRMLQPGAKLPHVIVLDLRKQASVPTILGQLKKEHPDTGVVIVASTLEPALMLEAMRAGVTECVAEPLNAKEIQAAIERIAGAQTSAGSAEVFAVIGAKGGVGTTTLAVNIATVLAATAAKQGGALLIDLEPWCGDAALLLGADARFSTLDAIENVHRLDDAYLKGLVTKSKAGPDVLASPDRAAITAADPAKVRAVVAAAARCYRYVVLDAPRGDVAAMEAMQLASIITVVTTQELSSIRSANRLATALRQRFTPERVRLVISRYDRASEIKQEDLERAVGGTIGHMFPSNYRLAVEALNKGRPVVVDNHTKLASSFSTYARSLAGLNPRERKDTSSSSGLFGRLTGRR